MLDPRRVEPRLEHDTPSDPVPSGGKRKIRASTQKPTRRTNVPIVYSRLMHRNVIDGSVPVIHTGDIVFVNKTDALFGTTGKAWKR